MFPLGLSCIPHFELRLPGAADCHGYVLTVAGPLPISVLVPDLPVFRSGYPVASTI